MVKTHKWLMAFALSMLALPCANAQFGGDGEGFILPMCQAWAQNSPEAKRFIRQFPNNERALWSRKNNYAHCNALIPKPIIQSCKAWLGLMQRQANGEFPEGTFRQAFDESTRAMLNNSDLLQPYDQCLDQR